MKEQKVDNGWGKDKIWLTARMKDMDDVGMHGWTLNGMAVEMDTETVEYWGKTDDIELGKTGKDDYCGWQNREDEEKRMDESGRNGWPLKGMDDEMDTTRVDLGLIIDER